MLWDGDEDNMKFIYVIAMYDSSSTAQPNTDWANKMQDMMQGLNFGEVKNTAQSNASSNSNSNSNSNNNDDNKDDNNDSNDDNSANDDKNDDNNTNNNSNGSSNDNNENQEEKVIMTEEECKEYWKGIKDWDENSIKWGVVDVSSDKDGDFGQLWSELIEPFHTGPQDR